MARTRAFLCTAALILLAVVPPAAQTSPTILSVHPDLGVSTLTIIGRDFTNANGVVRIGVPWTQQFEELFVYAWTNNAIVTNLPPAVQVAGTYRLLVTRADQVTTTMDITIGATGAPGATGPSGPQGAPGPQGLPGTVALAGQRCPAGRMLVGFLANGGLICEVPGQGFKTIFVSTSLTHGSFNGNPTLAGADGKCQFMANAAGLSGTYKAWLSAGDVAAAGRLAHATVPYVLPDGTPVAENWDDLVDGTLSHPISMNEYGDTITAPTAVWTGTIRDGSASASSCVSWTRETEQICSTFPKFSCFDQPFPGDVGDALQTDAAWSSARTQNCNVDARLYCVQQ